MKESQLCRQLVRHRQAGNMHTVMQKTQPEWQAGKSRRPKPDIQTSMQKCEFSIVQIYFVCISAF
jgi:hypothetical protein